MWVFGKSNEEKLEEDIKNKMYLDSRLKESKSSINLPLISFALVLIVQIGTGVWWASNLTTEFNNQKIIVNEKLMKIENRLDGTALIQITKDQLESKLELFKFHNSRIEEKLKIYQIETKTKYINMVKSQDKVDKNIEDIKSRFVQLEKTIGLLYSSIAEGRK